MPDFTKDFEDYFQAIVLLKPLSNSSNQMFNDLTSKFQSGTLRIIFDQTSSKPFTFSSDSPADSSSRQRTATTSSQIDKNQPLDRRISYTPMKDTTTPSISFPINQRESSVGQTFLSLFTSSDADMPPITQRDIQNARSKRNDKAIYALNLRFIDSDQEREYMELERHYTARFVLGILLNSTSSENLSLIEMAIKTTREEGKCLLGIVILSELDQLNYNPPPFQIPLLYIPPSLGKNELLPFIQPWLIDRFAKIEMTLLNEYHLLSSFCTSTNLPESIPVFNKSEERCQPKMLKKKRKGRLLKLMGDLMLLLRLPDLANQSYQFSFDQLKKCDDFLWLTSVSQGRIAASLCLGADRFSQIENYVNDSIVFARKSKILWLEVENYARIIKLFKREGALLDQFISLMITDIRHRLSDEERNALYLFFKDAVKAQRKSSYYLFEAMSGLLETNPRLSRLLLTQLLESSSACKWVTIKKHLLEYAIDLRWQLSSYPERRMSYLALLEHSHLTIGLKKIREILAELDLRSENIKIMHRKCQLIDIKGICVQTCMGIEPKNNKLGSIKKFVEGSKSKGLGGIVVGWHKGDVVQIPSRKKVEITFL